MLSNRDKSFFHPNCVPDRPPECNALFDAGMMQMLGTDFEQPLDRSLEFGGRNTEFFAYPRDGNSRNIGTALDKVEFSVAYDDFIGRQVVVYVGEVDRENFVAKERQRFEWIQSIDRQETRQFPMFSNRFQSPD